MDNGAAARMLAKKAELDSLNYDDVELRKLTAEYGGNRKAKRRAARELRRKKKSQPERKRGAR